MEMHQYVPPFTSGISATNTVLTDREAAFNTGSLFNAGSDTSAELLQSFLPAMAAFGKEVIPKAWKEVDRVIGFDRATTCLTKSISHIPV
jgi:cytochrome P450